MNTRLIVPMLCIGAVAFACVPRPHAASEAPVSIPATSAQNGQPLASSLTVSVDGGIELAFHVTNTTAKSMELRFSSGQTHDFIVMDAAGREIWRWSGDRMFTQALQTRNLGAGQTMTFREHWEPPGPSGSYTVVAQLTSSNHPVETRTEITVP